MSSSLIDEDYDLISNPGDFSLEASINDLHAHNLTVWEPEPCSISSKKIETTKWTASQIQEYVKKHLGERYTTLENKVLRIYLDGSFDSFTVR